MIRALTTTLFLLTSLPALAAPKHENYLGDEACRSCHAAQVDSFHQTAHYLTSAAPTQTASWATIHSRRKHPQNLQPEPLLPHGRQGKRLFPNCGSRNQPRSRKFARTSSAPAKKGKPICSGTKISSSNSPSLIGEIWAGSTAQATAMALRISNAPSSPAAWNVTRPTFEALPPPNNRYNTTGGSLGIQCEKCHGPGSDHVKREQAKSAPDPAILNPAHFSRDRQMDLCAWCHGGHGQPLLRRFPTFRAML